MAHDAETYSKATAAALVRFEAHARAHPAFYANRRSKCYLLFGLRWRGGGRAIEYDRVLPEHHAYVGNTVHVERRLHQHNGDQRRGARANRGYVSGPVCVVEGFEADQETAEEIRRGRPAAASVLRLRARTMSLLFERLWQQFGQPVRYPAGAAAAAAVAPRVGRPTLSALEWLDQLRPGQRRPQVNDPELCVHAAGAFSRGNPQARKLAELALLLTHPVWGPRRRFTVWCYDPLWRDELLAAWRFVYGPGANFRWPGAAASDAHGPELPVVHLVGEEPIEDPADYQRPDARADAQLLWELHDRDGLDAAEAELGPRDRVVEAERALLGPPEADPALQPFAEAALQPYGEADLQPYGEAGLQPYRDADPQPASPARRVSRMPRMQIGRHRKPYA